MSDQDKLRRAQLVRSNLEKLLRIPQGSYDEFAADFRNTEASLHLLQTAIQALLDLARGACASLGLDTPRTHRRSARPDAQEESTLRCSNAVVLDRRAWRVRETDAMLQVVARMR
jgi:hypothetical protein